MPKTIYQEQILKLSVQKFNLFLSKAGLLALRERRMKINQKDLRDAKEKVLHLKKKNIPEGLYL
jgi:26S proteasome regulatory subunit T2